MSWSPEGEWSSIVHTIPWVHKGSEITIIFLEKEKENLVPRGFRQRAIEEVALCPPLATMWAEACVHVHTHVPATTVHWLSGFCLAPEVSLDF